MPGTIDLNSVIAMMNQAAENSQRGAAIKAKPHNTTPLLERITAGKGKKAFEDATAQPKPVQSGQPLSSNMLMVDPVAQAIAVNDLDANQQNYLMQAFTIANGRV